GLLHGVVGLGERAQHAVGHRTQVPAVLLETPRQPFGLVHRSNLHRIASWERDPPGHRDVTGPASGPVRGCACQLTMSMGVPGGIMESWARSASWSRTQPWEMAAPVLPISESS